MTGKSGSCGRRWANSSWSSTPEKNWTPSPGNPTKPSDGAGPHARRRPDGVDRAALPVVWRGALDLLLPPARGGGPAPPGRGCRVGRDDPPDHRAGTRGRAADDHGASPACDGAAGEPEEDPSHPEAPSVAGPPAAPGATAACPGLGVAGDPAERTVGDRHDPSLLRPRWVVPPDGHH